MTFLRTLETHPARRGFARWSVLLGPILLATVPMPADLPLLGAPARAGLEDPGASWGDSKATAAPAGNAFGIDADWLEGDSRYGPMSSPAPAGIETSPLVRLLACGERVGPSLPAESTAVR